MEALARYLDERGMSRSEFSRRFGVSPATVHYWIKGDRSPTVETARRLNKATGIALRDIRPDIWGRKQ